MPKLQFCQVLISRFREMNAEARNDFVLSLMDSCEEPEELEDWAQTLAEMLFPEMVGDLIIRE